MKELSKEKIFEYSSKELLGVMRFDFYDGGLANQWSFDTVVSFCNGRGYDNETLVYIDLQVAKYVIKLVPVRDSYSYIYTYLKEVR